MPDFKAPKRIKATPAEWVELRAAKLGPCRCCSKENAVGLSVYPARHWNATGLESTLHHLLSKSLGGDDVADNLVPLCGSGTTGHHGLVEAHEPWACSLVGARLTVSERAYLIRKKGTEFVLRRYGVKEKAA